MALDNDFRARVYLLRARLGYMRELFRSIPAATGTCQGECPHHILMELQTAKEMLAEYLDVRPSEVDAMIRERIAERVSVLMVDNGYRPK